MASVNTQSFWMVRSQPEMTAKSPKPHYIVTQPAKQGVLLKKLLPASLYYRIIGRLG